jgi:hypothetical protein
VGQWLRRETAVVGEYQWYQWNGTAWVFVRLDNASPGGGPEVLTRAANAAYYAFAGHTSLTVTGIGGAGTLTLAPDGAGWTDGDFTIGLEHYGSSRYRFRLENLALDVAGYSVELTSGSPSPVGLEFTLSNGTGRVVVSGNVNANVIQIFPPGSDVGQLLYVSNEVGPGSWYQWDGTTWYYVRTDDEVPTVGPYKQKVLEAPWNSASPCILSRARGESQVGTTSSNVLLGLPTDMLDGQTLLLDIIASAAITLNFTGYQMPAAVSGLLPLSIASNRAVRVTILRIGGRFWVRGIDGPINLT